MTILHMIDFLALSAVIIVLCEELRKMDGRRHPLIAMCAVVIATLAFLCATYDIAGAPLTLVSTAADLLSSMAIVYYFTARSRA